MTGQQVLNIALSLMDEVTDNGTISEAETLYYRNKAPNILTLLQAELLPLATTPTVISDLTTNLLVDDRTAISVLPYGLAAHLLLGDNIDAINDGASYFNSRYEELKRKRKATVKAITDVYNVTNGMV